MNEVRPSSMPSPTEPGTRGFIIPIGGAEDKVSDRAILKRFVTLCGGRGARIAVIPTASMESDTGERYVEVLRKTGAGKVDVLAIDRRSQADDPNILDRLNMASGVFLTGGNQLRLSTILGGTLTAVAIRRLNARGVSVAGTSAGASFVSEHMIAFGKSGTSPKAGQVTLAPGLGLTNRIIVDQHFRQRDRLGRLLTSLAYNPFAIGVGLDEDTAAFLGPDNRMDVVGSGLITIVDVSNLEHSSMAEVEEDQPVQLVGIQLHLIGNGASYHLETRKARLAEK